MKIYLFILPLASIQLLFAPLMGEVVYGSGTVVEEKRMLPSYRAIDISGSMIVQFEALGENIVKIESEKNILPHVQTAVEGETLTISLAGNIKPSQLVKVTVGSNKILSLQAAGTCQIIDKQPLKVETLTLLLGGVVQATFEKLSVDSLEVRLSGSATLTAAGSIERQNVAMTGATLYQAEKLLSKRATISIMGAGKGWVNVKEALNLTLSGASFLGFRGAPKIEKNISGVARLEKLDK